jgi:spore germination protein YaaH
MTKLELVKSHGLRGFSVWLLGLEDPDTWKKLLEAGVRR